MIGFENLFSMKSIKSNVCFSDTDDITADNFMSRLDNGVIVCKLAKIIQERCDATQQAFNGKLSIALEEVIIKTIDFTYIS